MVKTYSAAAVSLSCRMKIPIFSSGVGVSRLWLWPRFLQNFEYLFILI